MIRNLKCRMYLVEGFRVRCGHCRKSIWVEVCEELGSMGDHGFLLGNTISLVVESVVLVWERKIRSLCLLV